MRVDFVITRADAVGGATLHVCDLAQGLLEYGHEASVLLGGEGAVTRELQARGVPFCSLRHLRRAISPLGDVRAVREIAAAVRRIRPDVVAAHTAKAGCLARLASARLRVPVVYTPHGWAIADRLSPRQGMLYRAVERLTAPLAAAIINVSQSERQLAERYGVGKSAQHRVIYNCIPDVALAGRARPAASPARIAMVARFEAPKDHSTLIAALAGLRDLEWQLVLAGDGPLLHAARRQVEALGIADRVRFLGECRGVAGLLAECQVLALSSRSEGFPISILEAMRAGLPVVASGVGGAPEAVIDGHNGYVVPRQSVEAMRSALARLLTDAGLRARMGAAGRGDYERRFRLERMLEQTFAVYEEVSGGPAGAPAGKWRSEVWQQQ